MIFPSAETSKAVLHDSAGGGWEINSRESDTLASSHHLLQMDTNTSGSSSRFQLPSHPIPSYHRTCWWRLVAQRTSICSARTSWCRPRQPWWPAPEGPCNEGKHTPNKRRADTHVYSHTGNKGLCVFGGGVGVCVCVGGCSTVREYYRNDLCGRRIKGRRISMVSGEERVNRGTRLYDTKWMN